MFSKLASFASKYKFLILAFWVIVTAALAVTAPSLSKVGVTDQSQFLPQNSESSRANELIDTKFAASDQAAPSTATLVVYDKSGLTQQDMSRSKTVYDWLVSNNAPTVISGVVSVFNLPELQSSLVSKDGTTMLMTIDFSSASLNQAVKQAIIDIRAETAQQQGTSFYLSGNNGLVYDLNDSVQHTIDRTTFVAIGLIIVLLLLVYRSPVAALVPLLAIGVSYEVAKGIVGFMAQAGVKVSTITDAYMVVTIFGVGTDYCLFLVSRFREELAGADRLVAMERSMGRIGPIILASATTVVIAFLCLTVSQLAMTRTIGWSLAIGIAVMFVAALTLVPALIALFGHYLYWPVRPTARANGSRRFGWAVIGRWIAARPALFAVPIVVVFVLPYFTLSHLTLSANTLAQIPSNVESAQGFQLIRAHFPTGELAPLNLVLESRDGSLLSSAQLQDVAKLGQTLGSVSGLSSVQYFSAPSGELGQLSQQAAGFASALTGGSFSSNMAAWLKPTGDELNSIAVGYPGVATSGNFTGSVTDLTNLYTLLSLASTAPPSSATPLMAQAAQGFSDVSAHLGGLAGEFQLTGNTPFVGWLRTTYFSTDGTATRMNLIMKTDPYSDAANAVVKQVRQTVDTDVKASGLNNVSAYVGGEAAITTDILDTSNSDFVHVAIIASLGILLVIIILLRSLLAPLYMVATVLFNFGATLGITTWIFLDMAKQKDLTNVLPVFLFVMLAAVGADYNIFLVSRIREEAEHLPIREAVQCAVANTGGVITSCGIILAGTFATLTTSPLPMVLQIGAPIAIGVMTDTFIVRALLVPSLAALAGRASWWPSSPSRGRNGVSPAKQ